MPRRSPRTTRPSPRWPRAQGVSPQQVALAWELAQSPCRHPDPRRQASAVDPRLRGSRRTRAQRRGPGEAGRGVTEQGDGVLVLDGGMSNVLEDRGHDLSSDLWTARLLLDDPGEVAAVHAAYYRAGADVATTASYQASVPGLMAAGLDRGQAEATIRASVTVAREIRDRACRGAGTEAAGGGVRRAVRRLPRGRVGVPRPVRRHRHRAARLPCAAARAPRGRPGRTCSRSRRSPTRTRPRCWSRCWRSSACRPGSRTP